jgi:hypothetical protein
VPVVRYVSCKVAPSRGIAPHLTRSGRPESPGPPSPDAPGRGLLRNQARRHKAAGFALPARHSAACWCVGAHVAKGSWAARHIVQWADSFAWSLSFLCRIQRDRPPNRLRTLWRLRSDNGEDTPDKPRGNRPACTRDGLAAPDSVYILAMVTGARPENPSARAAAGVKSITRPRTNGPRSLI